MFAHLERTPTDVEKFHISPEGPYAHYQVGYVRVDNRDQRRSVDFYHKDFPKITTTYARYIYQVKLWHEQGQLIPDHLEVDHINEDRLDDRFDNFQLLTRAENVQKSVALKPLKQAVLICPICKRYFLRLIGETQLAQLYAERISCCSTSCSNIFRLYNLPQDVRIWILTTQVVYTGEAYEDKYLDTAWWDITYAAPRPHELLSLDLTQYENRTAERVKTIREYLDQNYSYEKIEEILGLGSIEYLVYTYLPEYRRDARTSRNVDIIQRCLDKNLSIYQIADILGMTDSGVRKYIHTYFPAYRRRAIHDERMKRVEEMLKEGKLQKDIGQELGITQSAVSAYAIKIRNKNALL